MKITLHKDDLLAGIQHIFGVVEQRSTIPILSHVVMTAHPSSPTGEKAYLSIFATDLEMSICDSYPAFVATPGKITFPAKKLLDIVKMLPEGEVEISEEENNWVSLKSCNACFKVAGLPPDQFPLFASVEEDSADPIEAVIEAEIFSRLIQKTIFAAGENDVRHILNSVLIQIRRVTGDKARIRLVATDGHRLAIAKDALEMNRDGMEEENLIIPKKGIVEIKKLVDGAVSKKKGDSPPVRLTLILQKGMLTVHHEKVVLMIRLLNGNYPKYQQVIPQEQEYEKRITVSRTALLGALTRVSVMSEKRTAVIEMRIQTGQILLYSRTHEMGEASESVPTSFYGEGLTLHIMAHHLLDLLPVLEDDEMTFELKDSASACVVREKSERGLFILAPFKE